MKSRNTKCKNAYLVKIVSKTEKSGKWCQETGKVDNEKKCQKVNLKTRT